MTKTKVLTAAITAAMLGVATASWAQGGGAGGSSGSGGAGGSSGAGAGARSGPTRWGSGAGPRGGGHRWGGHPGGGPPPLRCYSSRPCTWAGGEVASR